MKLEKTKELAKIFNLITQELKTKEYNFNINVDAFNDAENDFFEELDYNILKCNKDLIISRFEKYFDEYYPYFDMNDFEDEHAELLSKYREFSGILDCLVTFEGLEEYRELVRKEQRKNAIKDNSTTQINNSIIEPKQTIIPDKILNTLQQNGYIENTEKPYKWIKTNSKTHGKKLNKVALIDLLCLLDYPDEVITDIKLLNECFTFPNNKPMKANNLTYCKEVTTGKLKRPIISEYHTELQTIVEQSKINL